MGTENNRQNSNDFSNKELKSILMTISVCLFHAIGKGPYSIRPIFFLNHLNDIPYGTYLLDTNIITCLCQSMNLFLFLLFNQEFRNRFKIMFLKKKINPTSGGLALNITDGAQTVQNE